MRPAPRPEVVPFLQRALWTADIRVRAAPYDGNEVYKLRGFVGYRDRSGIRSPVKVSSGLGAGDLEGVSSFVGQDNHLFLKPKAGEVATYLTVLTSRRGTISSITPCLAAAARRRTTCGVIYALHFVYPRRSRGQSAAEVAAVAKCGGAIGRRVGSGGRRISDYWFCGDPNAEVPWPHPTTVSIRD